MSTSTRAKTSIPTLTQKTLYLSHFTPSLMAPETLETMLVQREPLLTRCLDNVIESLRTGSSHHTLFVGPRGIGKTHLISLLHHRLTKSKEANAKTLIAWMREEEWGVTSFFELVLRILRTLDASYPQLEIDERTSPLYELPLKEAEKLAESILLDVLGRKRLIVLLENLDDLFEQLGDQGQKAWRAFIQNHNNMVLVGTTPSLFAGVSLHKSAFYGFFDIEPLKELEFEDVVSLLGKIAVERGDANLAAFIDAPEGRARIRAVHHLAEGNPRIYIIFAQFLSREALDELVPAFMHTLDELTPYYQARMKELSGQQRKIVEYLVNYRGAAPVKQIAKSCFITQQTCSSQLKQLKEKRYVRSIEQGRESYYELCEPLMRLCMEVKKQRGEPISLFVDFLRIWYTTTELATLLRNPATLRLVEKRHLERALTLACDPSSDPKTVVIEKALEIAIQNGGPIQIFQLLEEFDSVSNNTSVAWVRGSISVLRATMKRAGQARLDPKTLPKDFEDASIQEKFNRKALDAIFDVLRILRTEPGNRTLLTLAREERKGLENLADQLDKYRLKTAVRTAT
ncbi:MAG: AAA family ATPase [Rhodoferax sp.]|uniref:AAA family ATPase n=1 Tax=Rhodoferax sp. TaxID=50421 RepID=UPI00262C89F7|nr:AAA family ATPase [Rhodoferax sp.]MDD5333223.1 AAA family ATPase [Rhodoferax sp.]